MSGDDYKTDVNFSWFEEISTQYNCIEDLSLFFNNAVTCQDSVCSVSGKKKKEYGVSVE
jgi:hypothetical protein